MTSSPFRCVLRFRRVMLVLSAGPAPATAWSWCRRRSWRVGQSPRGRLAWCWGHTVMAPLEEAGEAEAPIVPEEALVESAPAAIDAPKVVQMRGGVTEASPMDAAMAQTSEPKMLASSAIGGSAPEGVPMMEEVPSAPIGATPMVAMADPSVGAGPS